MKTHIPPKRPPRCRHAQTSITQAEHQRLQEIADEHGITAGAVIYALLQPHLQPTKDATT